MPRSFVLSIFRVGAALFAMSAAAGSASAASEKVVTANDRTALSVTVYKGGFALVRDTRRVTLAPGETRLVIRDVSGKLRPETVFLDRNPGTAPSFAVISRNYYTGRLGKRALLKKFIGRTVRVIRTNPATGVETVEEAEVLSVADGLVLRIGDRIETGAPGRIVFDRLPAGLYARPTLVLRLDSASGGQTAMALTYLTGGVRWRADYVAELDKTAQRLDLRARVTLTNKSGASYRNARIRLVAGDVNRPRRRGVSPEALAYTRLQRVAAPARRSAPRRVFAYYVYPLPRPMTLIDQQTSQVGLMHAAAIPVKAEYRLDTYTGGRRLRRVVTPPVTKWLIFENNKTSGLGVPLPAGVVRVYERRGGNPIFIGADRMRRTPAGVKVALRMGTAFDVTAKRRQTDFRRRGLAKNTFEAAFEITLRNARKAPVSVVVRDRIPGDWTIVDETLRHEKVDANHAQWRVVVPAGSKTVLGYRVRVRR